MSSLPPGWGNRTNQMSEEDIIKRGGVAATKFASKQNQLQQSVYNDDYDSGSVPSYKTSDDVRQLYLKRIEAEEDAAAASAAASVSNSSHLPGDSGSTTTAGEVTTVLPLGWVDRQRTREVEAQQFGAFGRKKEDPAPMPAHSLGSAPLSSAGESKIDAAQSAAVKRATPSSSAEEALVRVATHTLDNMASALENSNVVLSAEDRAAFAEAMKRAMAAISRCR